MTSTPGFPDPFPIVSRTVHAWITGRAIELAREAGGRVTDVEYLQAVREYDQAANRYRAGRTTTS